LDTEQSQPRSGAAEAPAHHTAMPADLGAADTQQHHCVCLRDAGAPAPLRHPARAVEHGQRYILVATEAESQNRGHQGAKSKGKI
jgi:hypothetical protein